MEVGDNVYTLIDGEIKYGRIKRIYNTLHADVYFYFENKMRRKINVADLKKIERSKL